LLDSTCVLCLIAQPLLDSTCVLCLIAQPLLDSTRALCLIAQILLDSTRALCLIAQILLDSTCVLCLIARNITHILPIPSVLLPPKKLKTTYQRQISHLSSSKCFYQLLIQRSIFFKDSFQLFVLSNEVNT